MQIRELLFEETYKACSLWNLYAQNEIPYKKLSLEKFNELFINETSDIRKVNFVVVDEEKELLGFANGCVKENNEIAYVTYVLVHDKIRRQGFGKKLILALEDKLKSITNVTLTSFDAIFFNPINLEWIVPDTLTHDHPNSPGVDMSCVGYIWMKNVGYRDVAYQNSFYKLLTSFELLDVVKDKILEFKNKGITITFYDKNVHTQIGELFDNLENEQWREIIMANLERENPYPILIAQDCNSNNKVCGFTGPLYVQESKRGYFAGIGIHSDYRQAGIGKSLFCMLCQTLKDMGAEYMTLFTGENNPARNIYEYAGFKIVKSWSDMRKIIK